MIRRRMALATLALTLLGGQAWAQHSGHAHATHGGQVQKIGKFEAELVVKGTELSLYLNDEKDKPADAAKFAATAVVLAKGNQQKSVELKPAGGNKLLGKGDFEVDDKVRATVTLSAAGSELGKARFTIDAPKR